jgi:hypothetical protein
MQSSASGAAGPRNPWLVAMLALLGVVLAARAWCPLVGSDDFWAHAAVGRWIWQHGDVPRHTLFLWSATEPWVAHSWLGELGLYALLAVGGTRLVQIVTLAVVAAPFVLLFCLWRRYAPISTLTTVAFGLAITASSTRFEARPEVLTGLFLGCLLAGLIHWSEPTPDPRDGSRWRVALLVALPLLFALWINCHGQVANGVALLGLTVACDLAQDRASKGSLLLAATSVVAVAALLVNPYGVGYVEAFRAVNSATFAGIREWQPFWATPAMPLEITGGTFALVAVALVAWRANPARRWAHLAWLLFMTACFLRYSRFVSMLNLTSLAVLAANAGAIEVEQWRRWGSNRMLWLVRAAVMVWLAVALFEPLSRWWEVAAQGQDAVPAGVAGFLEEHQVPPRIFNDYENSSYLHWRLGGDPPLFIDLLNAYPDQVTLDYREIVGVTPKGKRLLDERDIGCVVLTRRSEGASLDPLKDYLQDSPHWTLVYRGKDGYVWVRRNSEAKP